MHNSSWLHCSRCPQKGTAELQDSLSKDQELGDGEAISIEFMTQTQVRDAVVSGELKHALALSALARVFPIWPMPFVQAEKVVSNLPANDLPAEADQS